MLHLVKKCVKYEELKITCLHVLMCINLEQAVVVGCTLSSFIERTINLTWCPSGVYREMDIKSHGASNSLPPTFVMCSPRHVTQTRHISTPQRAAAVAVGPSRTIRTGPVQPAKKRNKQVRKARSPSATNVLTYLLSAH